MIDEWAAAFRAKNIDELMSNHSPDIVLFDVTAPLQYRGADARIGSAGFRRSRVRSDARFAS
jgi:ketosteroid isomerase-like protein